MVYEKSCVYPDGSTDNSAILSLTASSVLNEGCPLLSRTISRLEWSSTRPGKLINEKRIAFMRLDTQLSPSTKRFIASLRFNVSIIIHHHAAFSPKSPDGSFPPARSLFITLCASSLLPHRPLYHLINSSPSISLFVTIPNTLYAPLPSNPITGNGKSSCISIPGRSNCLIGSRIAKKRYSGPRRLWLTLFGTKHTSAHSCPLSSILPSTL